MDGRLIAGVLALTLAGCTMHSKGNDTSAPSARPQIGAWGLDMAAGDTSVKPGDDFYRFAEGKWLATSQIPPDRTSWGSFVELAERSERQVREIAEALPANAPQGSTEQKAGDFYRAYLDTNIIEQKGLAPAQSGLQAIAAARTHEQLADLMGRPDLNLKAPLGVGITTDQKNPDRYIVVILQSGLSLPDRDYYLKNDPVFVSLRAKYQAHVERMLTTRG